MTNYALKTTNCDQNHPKGWFFCYDYNVIRGRGGENMFSKKRKVTFNTVARFNYELDTNAALKEKLKNLALCRNDMSKARYLSEILSLFSKEGLDITLKELDMLLLLRNKTDQLLLEQTVDR